MRLRRIINQTGKILETNIISSGVYYFLSFLRSDKKIVLVLTQGRSGSTLLMELLGDHPQIRAHLPHPEKKIAFPFRHLSGRSRLYFGKRIIVFRVFTDIFTQKNSENKLRGLLKEVIQKGGVVISLSRKDVFRQVVSHIIAREKGFHNRGNTTTEGKFYVDPELLTHRANWVLEYIKIQERVLEGLPHISLEYERDLRERKSQQSTSEEIIRTLALGKMDLQSRLSPNLPADLSESVKNWEEIMAIATQRGWVEKP